MAACARAATVGMPETTGYNGECKLCRTKQGAERRKAERKARREAARKPVVVAPPAWLAEVPELLPPTSARCPGCRVKFDLIFDGRFPGHHLDSTKDAPSCAWSHDYPPGWSPAKSLRQLRLGLP